MSKVRFESVMLKGDFKMAEMIAKAQDLVLVSSNPVADKGTVYEWRRPSSITQVKFFDFGSSTDFIAIRQEV